MAQATIKKWGNSPGIRFSASTMKAAALNVDDTVEITVEEGRIVIIPVRAAEYSLEGLLSGITPENVHEKVDFGKPIGKELI